MVRTAVSRTYVPMAALLVGEKWLIVLQVHCVFSSFRALPLNKILSFVSSTQGLYFLQGEHYVQKTCDHIHYCLVFFNAFVLCFVLKIKTTQAGT